MKSSITIKDCQQKAKNNKGVCLSNKYVNNHTRMFWKCDKTNHKKWQATWLSIRVDKWCPECGNKKVSDKLRLNTKLVEDNIEELGFKWIGSKSEYEDSHSKLTLKKIECGHELKRSYNNIKSGSISCPICTGFIGENKTREMFNQVFGVNFEKVRCRILPWLKIDSRRSLELDGYNSSLGFAFEYGNHEGYRYERYNSKQRIEYDRIKSKLCFKHGIKLFQIKENKSIFEQILKQAKLLDIKIKIKKEPKIELNRIIVSETKKYYDKACKIASQKGFNILTKFDGSGSLQKVDKICKRGHKGSIRLGKIVATDELKCRKCSVIETANRNLDKTIKWINTYKEIPERNSKNWNEKAIAEWIDIQSSKKNRNIKINKETMDKLKTNNMEWLFDFKKRNSITF